MKYIVNPVKGAKIDKYPKGDVYQWFGENPDLYKSIGLAGHNGIDIVKPKGTPILATAGTVCEVKNDPSGYGKHIRILTDPDENGDFLEITYGHLDEIYCYLGQRVKDGDIVAGLGNTGFIISGNTPYWGNAPANTGLHLHLGCRECSTKDTGWVSQYSTGQKAFIKNYLNGYKGAIDPLPFIENWFKMQVSTIQKLIELYQKLLNLLKK